VRGDDRAVAGDPLRFDQDPVKPGADVGPGSDTCGEG
jgi:hypothetical protein